MNKIDNEFKEMIERAKQKKKRWYKLTALLTQSEAERVFKTSLEITPTTELEFLDE